MSTTPAPMSGTEITAALTAVLHESEQYWQSLPTDRFLAAIGTGWSPAENVRHLTKSVRAVTTGLRLPRWLLAIRFGSAKAPSRSFDVLKAAYYERLAQGVTAGRFSPSARTPAADPEARRREIMERHREAVHALRDVAARWPERALDQRVLPHPALGRLTVREMLFFTIFHNQHHLELVRRKLGA